MDVPWLQMYHLVYTGFVHCGGAFQTPTHYGTSKLGKLRFEAETDIPISSFLLKQYETSYVIQ